MTNQETFRRLCEGTPTDAEWMHWRAIRRRHRRKGAKASHRRMLAQHYDRFGKWCPGAPDMDHEAHYLGKGEKLSIDHVVPKSKGGTNRLSNKRVLCMEFNRLKGDEMPNDLKAAMSTVIKTW